MTGRHEELRGLIAPFVLGAVSDEEGALIRSHLMSCEACLREADALEEAGASLALAVTPEPLPRGFAERVLEHASEQSPAPAATRRAPRWRRWLAGHAPMYGALALVAIVLAVGLVDARRDQDRAEVVLQALLRERGMDVEGPSGAVGRMIPTSGGGLFVVAGLQSAPAGHEYQLWLLRGGCETCKPASAGTFDVSDGLATLETDRSLDGVGGVAVTIEPDGGSPEPTSEPVISSG